VAGETESVVSPIFAFPPTPIPPATMTAPVVVDVEGVGSVISTPSTKSVPAKVVAPPTFKFPITPTPPATTSAPVFTSTDASVLPIRTFPISVVKSPT
jgi:hypothetical protein